MATINSFEDLDIWKQAQGLGKLVYFICEKNNKISKDFSFKDQIKRAVLSISNNIAEGFEYNNNKDFVRYLKIAKGSCGEVRNCLLFSQIVNYTNDQEINEILILTKELGTKIGGFIKYLKLNIAKQQIKPDKAIS